MSKYGKSQFALATVGDSEIAEAVKDSNEQLLLIVVSVVMIDDIGELAEVADIELELLPLDIVIFKLVIVVVLCVVGAVVTVDTGVIVVGVGVVKRSLLINGSNDDCDDKLKTEPQSMVLVLPLSIPSTSTPNGVSVLLTKGLVTCGTLGVWVLFVGGFEGNGVALPDDGSFNGWWSYVIGSLNVVTRFVG